MVFGIIAAFINFIIGAKRMMSDDGFSTTFAFHLFFGLFYVLGAIGSLVTGVIWAIQYIKA
jgi:hypothetical protein